MLKSMSKGQSVKLRPPKIKPLDYTFLKKAKKKPPLRALQLTMEEELELSKKISDVMFEQKKSQN